MARPAPKKTDTKRLTPEFVAQAGKGRPKGVTNKTTKAVREMVVEALNGAGGIKYLIKQANDNPKAFLSLVGKVIPLQVTGANGEPFSITHIQLVPVQPTHSGKIEVHLGSPE